MNRLRYFQTAHGHILFVAEHQVHAFIPGRLLEDLADSDGQSLIVVRLGRAHVGNELGVLGTEHIVSEVHANVVKRGTDESRGQR